MTNPSSSSKPWGKIIGGALGLVAGGPWGAALGFAIGHMHDTGRHIATNWSSYADLSAYTQQNAFTMGIVVLGAKMAKADGRVTRAEIEAFKRVFRINPQQETSIARIFDQARLSADGFEPYALQLAHMFRNNQAVLEEILSGLFIIGAADAIGLSPAEIVFLKRIGFIFGFSQEDFARIAARSGVNLPEQERPRDTTNEAFVLLGVSEHATAEEIKLAYRALIREHHPDKLMAEGMPPEFVATATEKMKRINVAYEAVCKIKGIK